MGKGMIPRKLEMMFASFSTPHPSANPSPSPPVCLAPTLVFTVHGGFLSPHVSPSKPTLVAPRTWGRCCRSFPVPGAGGKQAGEGSGCPLPRLGEAAGGLWTVWLCQAHAGIPQLLLLEGSGRGFCFSNSCNLLRPG